MGRLLRGGAGSGDLLLTVRLEGRVEGAPGGGQTLADRTFARELLGGELGLRHVQGDLEALLVRSRCDRGEVQQDRGGDLLGDASGDQRLVGGVVCGSEGLLDEGAELLLLEGATLVGGGLAAVLTVLPDLIEQVGGRETLGAAADLLLVLGGAADRVLVLGGVEDGVGALCGHAYVNLSVRTTLLW